MKIDNVRKEKRPVTLVYNGDTTTIDIPIDFGEVAIGDVLEEYMFIKRRPKFLRTYSMEKRLENIVKLLNTIKLLTQVDLFNEDIRK